MGFKHQSVQKVLLITLVARGTAATMQGAARSAGWATGVLGWRACTLWGKQRLPPDGYYDGKELGAWVKEGIFK